MYCPNVVCPRVNKQDRQTVGGSDADQRVRLLRYKRIAFTQPRACARRRPTRNDKHPVGMNLFRRDQPAHVRPVLAQARSKAVFEPRELFKGFGAVYVMLIETEQPSF